jgi:hypothetical protein
MPMPALTAMTMAATAKAQNQKAAGSIRKKPTCAHQTQCQCGTQNRQTRLNIRDGN